MKLTAKIDIEAPPAFVYRVLLDHPAWEHEARLRGIPVERPPGMPEEGVGAGWKVQMPFRGKTRSVLIRIDAAVPDQNLTLWLEGQALQGQALIDVWALSQRRTRMRLMLDLTPKTLAARLFLNAVRLAKGRAQARLQMRLGQFATRVESRVKRIA